MFNKEDFSGIPKGLLLVFLGISGNFLAQTMGCRFQELLTNNMFAKSLFVFFIIYFTVNFTASVSTSPTKLFVLSVLVWLFFVLLSKNNLVFTLIVLVLLIILFTINNYIDYYKNLLANETDENKKKKYNELIDKLDKAYLGIELGALTLLIIGFIIYFGQKYKEYKNKEGGFKLVKFIFGNVACRRSDE